MNNLTVIFGNGAIGGLVTKALVARGDRVRIAQRSHPAETGAEFMATDILDAAAVRQAVAGTAQVMMAVGFTYDSRLWRKAWPRAMTNVVKACAAVGARIVLVDNLY